MNVCAEKFCAFFASAGFSWCVTSLLTLHVQYKRFLEHPTGGPDLSTITGKQKASALDAGSVICGVGFGRSLSVRVVGIF